jgi:MOSC domain-containing protein YiiM
MLRNDVIIASGNSSFRQQSLDMLPPVSPVVLCGGIRALPGRDQVSAIAKAPIDGPWQIARLGLKGDAQADLKHHGGPEKAIHHYPRDHYGAWRNEIGTHPLLDVPGAFGENLSTAGWTERTVHIGDVVRFGSALLQVSQGRQPCWKLNAYFGRGDIARRSQESGRTGWYYRVLEEGAAEPGDRLTLVARPRPEWPLSRLIALLYRDKDRYGELEQMAALEELATGWRDLASRRIQTRATEDWSQRLDGPRP